MSHAVFTIIAKNYLAQARALMASVAEAEPDARRFVVLVDEPDGLFDPAEEPFEVIGSLTLPIERVRWFHFKYTVLELNTAVKPYAAQAIFDRYDIEKLVYLDPDILVFGSLTPVFEALDRHTIALTPHLTAPIDDDGRRPSERTVLRCGSYNLGFIGLRRDEETRRFLAWWASRLYDDCRVEPEKGLFVDQKWVDLAPGLFENVGVVRDPGWNVAYWNLHARRVERAGGEYRVDGAPLVFFHYSGFDPHRPRELSKYQDRLTREALGAVVELLDLYRRRVLELGFEQCSEWPYSWGRFADGNPLPDCIRAVDREDSGLVERVDDPFSAEGKAAMAAVWNEEVRDPAGAPSGLSRLAVRLHETRRSLREAMPDLYGADRLRLANWLSTVGARRERLPDVFVTGLRERLDEMRRREVRRQSAPVPLDLDARSVDLLDRIPALTGVLRTTARPHDRRTLEERFNEPATDPELGLKSTALAVAIARQRDDVVRACSRNGVLDAGAYLSWLTTHGLNEYPIPRSCQALIEEDWRNWLHEQPAARRIIAELRRNALAVWLGRREQERPDVAPAPESAQLAFGVNLIGYLDVAAGVGESARLAASALDAVGIPCTAVRLSFPNGRRESDRRPQEDAKRPYRFDWVVVNADELPDVLGPGSRPIRRNRYTIGYWAWELETFPERFDRSFYLVDEIWTPSGFCRAAIEARSPHPVVTIPHPVREIEPRDDARAELGLDDGVFTFLTMADLRSVFERKNPLATIRAFRRAFGEAPEARLIVKVSCPEADPDAMAKLEEAASGCGVRLIAETWPRQAVDDLLGAVDCVVSLHRSEGFGLVMAEAMSLGKPVVATAYSGNLDYMDARSAYLVDYRLVEAGASTGPYAGVGRWAEPDEEHAAELLREALADEAGRERIAAAGRERVRRGLAPAVVGERVAARLKLLGGGW